MVNEKTKGRKMIADFEKRIENRGFTKRIVTYDFLKKLGQTGFIHWWIVGIWIDYKKQLITIRPNRDTWQEIDVPFKKIHSVEVIEDVENLRVRIVTGSLEAGSQAYNIVLYEPKFNVKFTRSDPYYKAIQECARSIYDEIGYITSHSE